MTQNLNPREREFLSKLVALCEEYGAAFHYTNDDDGLHVELHHGTDIRIGYGSTSEMREVLQEHDETYTGDIVRDDSVFQNTIVSEPGKKTHE